VTGGIRPEAFSVLRGCASRTLPYPLAYYPWAMRHWGWDDDIPTLTPWPPERFLAMLNVFQPVVNLHVYTLWRNEPRYSRAVRSGYLGVPDALLYSVLTEDR